MNSKVTRVISLIFLAVMLVIFIGTCVTEAWGFGYALFSGYKELLTDDSDVFDVVDAKVTMLTSATENNLFGRELLRQVNVRLQRLQGKQTIDMGTHKMAELSCGGFYDLYTDVPDMSEASALAEFLNTLDMQAAFLYCHGGLYEEGLLSEELELLDTNIEFADMLDKVFEEAGVTYVDTRTTYTGHGFTIGEALNKTDIHWKHRLALAAAQDIAAAVGLDSDRLDISLFADECYTELLLGEFGQRIGISLTGLDDVHLLYPLYETYVSYEELGTDVYREGSFLDATVYKDRLERNSDGYNIKAYYIYGDYLAQKHIHNDLAEDKTVLVFTDSYGSPVSVFLGLVARDVYAIDPRSTELSMEEWVEQAQPDIVIIAYSQQMLRNYEYVIM